MTPVPRPIRRSPGAPHQPLKAGIRRRTRIFVLASTLAVLAAIVSGALILDSGLGGVENGRSAGTVGG
jgi:hypothetical protein